jgi:glycosyltransferase involved in cell wall biosynthesis
MSKYMFFLPRFHTNAVPWARILKDGGHAVEIHCVLRGPTEDYSVVTPRIHTQSTLSRWIGGCANVDRLLFPRFHDVYSAISRAQPDVIIVRGLTRWFMRMAAVAAMLQRRKVVVYDQEAQDPPLSTTWVRRAACRLIGIAHFSPKFSTRQTRKSWGSALVIPFGCPFAETYRGGTKRRSGEVPRILIVSKYRERKRHQDLLCALSRLADTHKFTLTVCGEEVDATDTAFCASLRQLAGELGLASRIEFRNNIPHSAMWELYLEHDVFVLPAVNEPAAISPLEAAWCGCAVLIASDSGTRCYVPPGPLYEFRAADTDSLAEALWKTLQDPGSVARAREECHRWINQVAGDELILECFEKLVK